LLEAKVSAHKTMYTK